MPATVIAERIGWTRGLTVLKERVRELRPAYLPPDPAEHCRVAWPDVVVFTNPIDHAEIPDLLDRLDLAAKLDLV